MQTDGENYLLPCKMPEVKKPRDISHHGMPMEYVLSKLEQVNLFAPDCDLQSVTQSSGGECRLATI